MNQAIETLGYLWPLLLAGAVVIAALVTADAWWRHRNDPDEGDPLGDSLLLEDNPWLTLAPKHRAELDEHGEPRVLLVAFTVWGDDDEDRQERLMARLPATESGPIEDWWIAEDTRIDHSDSESAVFVPRYLSQTDARRLLEQQVRS